MLKQFVERFRCEGCKQLHLFKAHRDLCTAMNKMLQVEREKAREMMDSLANLMKATERTARIAALARSLEDEEEDDDETDGVAH